MAEGSPWACTRLGAMSWRRGGSAFLLSAAQGGIEAVARRSRRVGTSRFGTSVLNAVPPRRGVARRHAAPARRGVPASAPVGGDGGRGTRRGGGAASAPPCRNRDGGTPPRRTGRRPPLAPPHPAPAPERWRQETEQQRRPGKKSSAPRVLAVPVGHLPSFPSATAVGGNGVPGGGGQGKGKRGGRIYRGRLGLGEATDGDDLRHPCPWPRGAHLAAGRDAERGCAAGLFDAGSAHGHREEKGE
jgi:hypothetical protein